MIEHWCGSYMHDEYAPWEVGEFWDNCWDSNVDKGCYIMYTEYTGSVSSRI